MIEHSIKTQMLEVTQDGECVCVSEESPQCEQTGSTQNEFL